MPRLVRRLCGQVSIGPRGERDQSRERMSAPISPPPTSQELEGVMDTLWRRVVMGQSVGRPWRGHKM